MKIGMMSQFIRNWSKEKALLILNQLLEIKIWHDESMRLQM